MIIFQFVAAILLATGIFFWIPLVYTVVGVLTMLTVFSILAWREHELHQTLEQHKVKVADPMPLTIEIFYRLVLSFIIGLMWPTLPVLIWFGRAFDTEEQKKDTDSDQENRSA